MTIRRFALVSGGALLGVAVMAVAVMVPKLRVNIPDYQPPGELVQLEQNWTEAQRTQFHYTAQGTRLLPYKWFLALEQPCFSLSGCELLAAPGYLERFGFLAGKRDPVTNPDGLPIGFGYQKAFFDPETKQTYPVVGLTCAACHTGMLRYDKYAVQIDGAPALIEISEFQKALGLAMAFTKLMPFRYGRFEARVLGPNAPQEQKDALKASFNRFLDVAKAEKKATDKRSIYADAAGFGRTDALTRIGNQVFAVDMKNDDNFAPSNAPVRFPQLWDASWFNWVQYNSSIADPLIRNIGEALGVRAAAKLYGSDAVQFPSSVDVPGLKDLEALLSGPAPFSGLSSPKWPSVFPKLDPVKVARGESLYRQHCQGCHLPPMEELRADLHSGQPKHWWKNRHGAQFLIVTDVPIDYVGTDPRQATDFMERTADTGDLGKGRVSAAVGLDLVTTGIRTAFFQKSGFSPAQQLQWSGNRDPGDPAVRAERIYKARPLNGIWAVAPYLHNGAVPNLYQLLSPVKERSDKFWLGDRRFDPVHVGYSTAQLKGGYLYNTATVGNSNKGHEFKDGNRGKGVIGPFLPPDDRWALIEYLKSI